MQTLDDVAGHLQRSLGDGLDPATPVTRSKIPPGRRNGVARLLRAASLGETAASLAHEVSQPLAAVANLFEACRLRLRRLGAASRKPLRLLDQAVAETLRAGRIVRHVAGCVRRDARRLTRFDLRRVVRQVPLSGLDLRRHGMTLRFQLGDERLDVRACRIEIDQVVSNLLRNAVEAVRQTNGRPREVIVSARRYGDRVARVTVLDSGTGISPLVARRLFEPFFTTKADGFGMGLAICRAIVEIHGGHPWAKRVESPLSTAITFTLPLVVGSARTPSRTTPATAR